jgi:glucosamine kinase
MKLLADSGGTGTDWALKKTNETVFIKGRGLHPDAINSQTTLPDVLIQNKDQIEDIWFYGTGCAIASKAKKVEVFLKQFFKRARITVYSDLLALAHPIFGKQKGLIGILGTGSSMCHYDGTEIHFEVSSPGKGLDPGSGPVIAKLVWEKYKSMQLGQDARILFDDIINGDYPDENVLRQISNTLFQNLDNPECVEIVKNAFLEYIDFYRPMWSKYYHPIVLGGTIAALGEPILTNVLKRKGIQLEATVRYPIEKLVEFYQ